MAASQMVASTPAADCIFQTDYCNIFFSFFLFLIFYFQAYTFPEAGHSLSRGRVYSSSVEAGLDFVTALLNRMNDIAQHLRLSHKRQYGFCLALSLWGQSLLETNHAVRESQVAQVARPHGRELRPPADSQHQQSAM